MYLSERLLSLEICGPGFTIRVITKNFLRGELRPARLLRAVRSSAAKSLTTLLLTDVPAGSGARSTTGAAVEASSDLSRRY